MHVEEGRSGALAISILGPTAIIRDGVPVDLRALGGVKPRQVLEVLALNAGRAVPRDRLAEMVWDESPPAGYSATLQSYVCLVRRALGLAGRSGGIATVFHGYLLDPEAVTVDLCRFRDLARRPPAGERGPGGDAARLVRLVEAVALVSGDLLASESYASWASSERDHFARELAGVATEAAGCALRLGRATQALELARIATDSDPYAEEAWRYLIGALCATGRHSEALRAYAELRELLAEELGTSPSRATTECYLVALGAAGHEAATDPRDELRLLLALVKRTVLAVPGVDLRTVEQGLGQLAAGMSVG